MVRPIANRQQVYNLPHSAAEAPGESRRGAEGLHGNLRRRRIIVMAPQERAPSLALEFAHDLDNRFHVIYRSFRQDAVT